MKKLIQCWRRRLLPMLLISLLIPALSARAQLPVLWDNATGDGLWNYTSKNWHVIIDPIGTTNFSDGMDVFFPAGTDTITIEPDTIEPGVATIWAGDYTFQGGSFTGGARIVKEGTGTLTLQSPNVHTGGLVVTDGVVVSAAQGSMGAGPVFLEGGDLNNSGSSSSYAGELHVKTNATIRPGGWMTLAGPIIGEGDLTIIGNGFTVMRDNSATFHGDWYQHTGDMFDYRPSGALGTGTLFWNSGLGGSWFSGTHVIHSNDVVLGAGLRYLRRAGDHAVEFAGTISGPGGLHDGETYSTADAAVLILSGENTYNGATYASSVAWQSSAPRTVEIRGSLGNANIFVSSRLRGGSGPGQQGTVNFNIRNNTNDLIRVYPGGVLELDNLVLAVQFSGTQTSNEYVIADYSGAITTGEEFYEIQGLGALFVFGGIEYYRGEFLWRIHYAGTQANPGNKIVIARTVPLDAMLFLLR